MIRSTRRTMLRLMALGLLLLAFPVAALLLRSMSLPPRRPVSFDLSGSIEAAAGGAGYRTYSLRLALTSRAPSPWRVEQVFLTLLDGEDPVWTLIEDRPAIEARSGGAVRIAPGSRVEIGPIPLVLAPGTRGQLLLASVRVREQDADESATAEAELPWPAP